MARLSNSERDVGRGNAQSVRSAAKVARGYRRNEDGNFSRRIVISLDDETFDAIAGMAAKRSKSFAFVARELIEFGLIDVGAA